jgi:diamine N-acetyltransferase
MIYGELIRLRAIEYNDLPLLIKWRNDPSIYVNFFEYEPLSLVMEEIWFDKFLERTDEKYWIAETRQDDLPIGTIALIDIDLRNRKAEIGRVLVASPDDKNKGYGFEMLDLLLKYSFEHLNLNRLYLEVFAENHIAIEFYQKAGFIKEGCKRQHIFTRARYRDVLLFSILSEEYFVRSNKQ